MATRRSHERIDKLRMYVQCLIRGNGPWRRGPDHGVDWTFKQRFERKRVTQFQALARGGERKAHVDRAVDAVFVFDLRLGKRAMAIEAPVDWLQSPIQIAEVQNPAERANLVRLALEIHRRI